MDWKTALCKAGIILEDRANEYIEQRSQEEVENARAMQREEDILAAIMGFIDLKASDMDILGLLQKHYGIDSISKGKKYIADVRIIRQCNKLKTYLGISGAAWIRYRNEYAVVDRLKSDQKLLELPVEKLKARIEKGI